MLAEKPPATPSALLSMVQPTPLIVRTRVSEIMDVIKNSTVGETFDNQEKISLGSKDTAKLSTLPPAVFENRELWVRKDCQSF